MNNQSFTLISGVYFLMINELQGSAAKANSAIQTVVSHKDVLRPHQMDRFSTISDHKEELSTFCLFK